MGGYRIEGAFEIVPCDGPDEHRHQIVDVNPALPLQACPQGCAESQSIQRDQPLQNPSMFREHQSDPQEGVSPSQGAECPNRILPIANDFCQESFAT